MSGQVRRKDRVTKLAQGVDLVFEDLLARGVAVDEKDRRPRRAMVVARDGNAVDGDVDFFHVNDSPGKRDSGVSTAPAGLGRLPRKKAVRFFLGLVRSRTRRQG